MALGHVLALLASLFLLVTAAFLAMAETSLTRLPHARAKALLEEGRRGAASLEHLLANRQRALNPVLLAVLTCHLSAAVMLGLVAHSYFGAPGLVLVTVFEIVVIFVLAEAAPKTYALEHPEQSALMVAPVVNVLVDFAPYRLVTRLLIGAANVVLPGKGRKEGPGVSEEELLAMADVAVEADVLEVEERALIRSIIDFGDTVVREVMVPRPDMVTIPVDATVGEAMETVVNNGYSRVPVCGDGIDDVVGMVYAKDLLRATRDGRRDDPAVDPAAGPASVDGLMREAQFVPETKRVAELLREMQSRMYHMAIVVDEYGSTAGLVTLEDLIEELVGEIVDEFDVEDPMMEPLPGGGVRVNARLSVDELDEFLQLDLPKGDWDTVGGLMLNLLGHPAVEGETVELDDHRLRAERVQGRRIGRVRITPLPRPRTMEAESS
ncbi:MAG: HlyC/CorC family transporter [Actinobacteria bacterium]|nr:HlyC/CorC family transporter [Actinomycetota bacterium]